MFLTKGLVGFRLTAWRSASHSTTTMPTMAVFMLLCLPTQTAQHSPAQHSPKTPSFSYKHIHWPCANRLMSTSPSSLNTFLHHLGPSLCWPLLRPGVTSAFQNIFIWGSILTLRLSHHITTFASKVILFIHLFTCLVSYPFQGAVKSLRAEYIYCSIFTARLPVTKTGKK